MNDDNSGTSPPWDRPAGDSANYDSDAASPPWDRPPGVPGQRVNQPANEANDAVSASGENLAAAPTPSNLANNGEAAYSAALPASNDNGYGNGNDNDINNAINPQPSTTATPPAAIAPSTQAAPEQPNYGTGYSYTPNNDNADANINPPDGYPSHTNAFPADTPDDTGDPYANDGYPSNSRMWPYRAEQYDNDNDNDNNVAAVKRDVLSPTDNAHNNDNDDTSSRVWRAYKRWGVARLQWWR